MAKPRSLKDIERQVQNLSRQDKQKLLARLIQRTRQSKPKKSSRNWAKLYGLGKGLWNGEDAQDYVNRLREDRV